MELTRAMAAGVAMVEGAQVMPAPVFAIKRDGTPVQKTPLGVWHWNGYRFADEGGAERDELPEWPLWTMATAVHADARRGTETEGGHGQAVEMLERTIRALQSDRDGVQEECIQLERAVKTYAEKLTAMTRDRDEWKARAEAVLQTAQGWESFAKGAKAAGQEATDFGHEMKDERDQWKARAVAAESALEMTARRGPRQGAEAAETAGAERIIDLDRHRPTHTIPVGPEVEVAGIPDVVIGQRDQFGNVTVLVGAGE